MRPLVLLLCVLLCMLPCGGGFAAAAYAPVVAGKALVFPADYGSHADFRTEWWYVTGWLHTEHGESLGFQITFFRTKSDADPANPSAFAPRQLLIAHCAISDPQRGRLWQDQKIRRAGLGLAEAKTGDTDVWVESWVLRREHAEYRARIDADDFSLALTLTPTQDPLLNGDAGFSRKDPQQRAASYYYSVPHLRVSGSIVRAGAADGVSGEAWFDHEWSSEYLDGETQGWDWTGINFSDGASLMAFRMRGLRGTKRWAGGTYRAADGHMQILLPDDVDFVPQREWLSPRTGIHYPVQWRVRAGAHQFELQPLMDDQENDTRLSTGAIYWEGLSDLLDAQDRRVGRGYLEMTGYAKALTL